MRKMQFTIRRLMVITLFVAIVLGIFKVIGFPDLHVIVCLWNGDNLPINTINTGTILTIFIFVTVFWLAMLVLIVLVSMMIVFTTLEVVAWLCRLISFFVKSLWEWSSIPNEHVPKKREAQ